MQKYKSLMGEGQKHHLCGEYDKSSEALGEACELVTVLFGEGSLEYATTLYHYGSAMFEKARTEQGVIGEKVVDKENDVEEEEAENAAPRLTEDAEGDYGDEDEEEEEEDVSTMQVAWETLELAEYFFEKLQGEHKDDDQVLMNIAKCAEKLADMGLETEKYEECIEKSNKCLGIYEKLVADKTDRRFASAHYCIGLAQFETSRFDEAETNLGRSVKILQKKQQALLESSVDDRDEEISGIEAMINEVKHKIEDIGDMRKAHTNSKNTLRDFFKSALTAASNGSGDQPSTSKSSPFDVAEQSSSSSSSAATSSNQADDITHLVRRKRPSDITASTTTANTTPSPKKRRVQLS